MHVEEKMKQLCEPETKSRMNCGCDRQLCSCLTSDALHSEKFEQRAAEWPFTCQVYIFYMLYKQPQNVRKREL